MIIPLLLLPAVLLLLAGGRGGGGVDIMILENIGLGGMLGDDDDNDVS